MGDVVVPRNFRLLEELDQFEKGCGRAETSAGLEKPDDIFLNTWNASIVAMGGRFFQLKIICGPRYPHVPPEVHFISQINLPCVDSSNGKVNMPAIIPSWKYDKKIKDVLDVLKAHCDRAPRNQPAEGLEWH
ncbi:ubiquitin-conjugating enzyme/RWD-like protein [Pelagophyceae sp. CCMP2097]|nr:ubiquitin-conjugating enzyme/RWD-like protein [Pelagophyceae sp. CCMP2097]